MLLVTNDVTKPLTYAADVNRFFDARGDTDLDEERHNYWAIVALSVRQIMASYVLAGNVDEPFLFQKEISSNGNTNTVDVVYPAMPFFLYASPKLLKYVLEPIFLMQEAALYPNEYAMHGTWLLTTSLPFANDHVHMRQPRVIEVAAVVFRKACGTFN